MRILFLDMDGVMNNAKSSHLPDQFFPIEPYAVLLLDRIIQATGCKIVLSSSWRHMPDWREILKKRMPSIEILDRTPRYSSSSKYGVDERDLCRGHNIQDWLDEHPEVERYAIVDDSADMLSEHQRHFFKTSWHEGLTEELANSIIADLLPPSQK